MNQGWRRQPPQVADGERAGSRGRSSVVSFDLSAARRRRTSGRRSGGRRRRARAATVTVATGPLRVERGQHGGHGAGAVVGARAARLLDQAPREPRRRERGLDGAVELAPRARRARRRLEAAFSSAGEPGPRRGRDRRSRAARRAGRPPPGSGCEQDRQALVAWRRPISSTSRCAPRGRAVVGSSRNSTCGRWTGPSRRRAAVHDRHIRPAPRARRRGRTLDRTSSRLSAPRSEKCHVGGVFDRSDRVTPERCATSRSRQRTCAGLRDTSCRPPAPSAVRRGRASKHLDGRDCRSRLRPSRPTIRALLDRRS